LLIKKIPSVTIWFKSTISEAAPAKAAPAERAAPAKAAPAAGSIFTSSC
jgi:hypothetical protein